ncbi:MAG TPA: GYD domain-containing protein [Streptosporangiaceae bacterium]|nr:GYD domain-containing protein [Streptosporangiaceae bacterium]
MSKYMFTAHYTSASWARLVKAADDRIVQVRSLLESLGGSLDLIYWDADSCAAHAIADLPDTLAVKTFVNTVVKTGAFTDVEAHELLNQDQLSDTLALTRSAQQFYEAPGKAAVDPS